MSTDHSKTHARVLYPVNEAREKLGGISRSSFYILVADGTLNIVKLGRRTFVHTDELERFIDSLPSSGNK